MDSIYSFLFWLFFLYEIWAHFHFFCTEGCTVHFIYIFTRTVKMKSKSFLSISNLCRSISYFQACCWLWCIIHLTWPAKHYVYQICAAYHCIFAKHLDITKNIMVKSFFRRKKAFGEFYTIVSRSSEIHFIPHSLEENLEGSPTHQGKFNFP